MREVPKERPRSVRHDACSEQLGSPSTRPTVLRVHASTGFHRLPHASTCFHVLAHLHVLRVLDEGVALLVGRDLHAAHHVQPLADGRHRVLAQRRRPVSICRLRSPRPTGQTLPCQPLSADIHQLCFAAVNSFLSADILLHSQEDLHASSVMAEDAQKRLFEQKLSSAEGVGGERSQFLTENGYSEIIHCLGIHVGMTHNP